MNNYPKVTIGIPVYNQEQFIESTILSVLNQDYPNLEIIVSDDCSFDNTNNIINKLKKKYDFQYFRNELNIGMVANYRKILYEYATGEWYLNLDGDDLLAGSDVISKIILEIKRKSNDNIILFSGEIIKLNNLKFIKGENNKIYTKVVNGVNYFEKTSLRRNFAHAACLYYRKLAIELDFYSENALNSDFQSIIRLCFKGNFIISNFVVSNWREHQSNQTNSVNNSKKSKEIIGLAKIKDYASSFIGVKRTNIWYDSQLKNAEIYRLIFICQHSGFFRALFSHFIPQERLPKQINFFTLIKFVFLSIRNVI